LQTKIRQHVNPLSARHQVPICLPEDWIKDHFQNIDNPFVIDVGCAKGTWAAQYAQDHPETNVIGIDIREPIIELANARAERLGITNVHYIYTNANVNISRIIDDISKHSTVQRITINFPDPYFKKRHYKRRLVNNAFVRALAQGLSQGAEVCFQSDVLELCLAAVKSFASGPWFTPCTYHDVNDLEGNKNPTGVLTEREISVIKRKLKVYRISYVRT
ncbi:unnamed protein product, partial [Ectocarpus fasciculatus]